MLIEFLLTLSAFLAAIIATLGNTTNATGKLSSRGYWALAIGLISFCASIFKAWDDQKQDKKKDREIFNLQATLDSTKSNADSIKQIVKKNDSIQENERRLLFGPKKIAFTEEFETHVIPFSIDSGMSIRIVEQNCDGNLHLVYNDKERRIYEQDDEFHAPQYVNNGHVLFQNKGDVICNAIYEVWGTSKAHRNAQKLKKRTEKFYVSIGCYKTKDREARLRGIFKIPKKEQIEIHKTGNCYRYLLSVKNSSLIDAQKRCNSLKRENEDCIVMLSIRNEKGNVEWHEYED